MLPLALFLGPLLSPTNKLPILHFLIIYLTHINLNSTIMKTTSKVLALAGLLTAASQGATTITGTLGGTFKANDGVTNATTGSLVMLIADTGNDGFLNLSMAGLVGPAAVTPGLSGLSGRTITAAQAGITAGATFGGDTVVNTSLTGASGSIAGILAGVDISAYVSKNFAVVWFNKTPAALGAVGGLANEYFGMIRLSDWTLPAADAGLSYALNPTDASGAAGYFSTSAATTATQVGAGFFTGSGTAADAGSTAVRSAQFQIVPEPSAALLGALGALGLLRRRRI